MALLYDLYSNFGLIVVTSLVFYISYFLMNYGFYWLRKNVPGPIPLPLVGNYFSRWMGTKSLADYDHRLYSDYGGKRYCGFFEFSQKSIMIGDLNILKHILIKDFDNFVNRSNVSMADPIVNKMVLVLKDEKWKKVRSILTPAFSSGKIKAMVSIMEQTCQNFMEKIFDGQDQEVDLEMCGILRRYSMDIVATVAFGIEINELEGQKGLFTSNARKIFVSLPRWRRFIALIMSNVPLLAQLTNYTLRDKEAPLFFKKVIADILRKREREGIQRNDFLQILKEAQDSEAENPKYKDNPVLTEDVFLAQCITFFAAGIDPVSTTLSLVFHNLAYHQNVQEKVLKEIDSALSKTDGKITYESLREMTYLDMVLQETGRMYPSAPRSYRVCKNYYTLPGTDVTLEPGTTVVIPIRSIHFDPEYYRDPTRFDPERFSADALTERKNPLAFLTYGQGPRNCIGMRFALMEMKVCVAHLLRQSRVFPSEQSKNPLKMNKLSGMLKVSGGVWLKIKKRTVVK